MNKEQIKQYYERIEKLLNGANKETYAFSPEEIRQILKWYEHLQQENKKLKENWNKLKTYIEENLYFYSGHQVKYALEKMQELEKGDMFNV